MSGLLLVLRGHRKAGLVVTTAGLLAMFLAAITPVHDALLLPLENRYPALSLDALPEYDAIVVLGGGTIGGSAELSGRSSPTPEATKRLVYAAMLFRARQAPIFVSGGIVTGHDSEPEAVAARRILSGLGLPDSMIHLEDKSRTTRENAANIASLLIGTGFRNVVLVTSAYHMPRSVLAFTRIGVHVIAAPTDYRVGKAPYGVASFLPSFHALSDSIQALREYLGFVQYSLSR
jgi:uncharacterized SAM-binding protein YcdF (DUF218 family)